MGAYITEIIISHKRITHRIFYRRKKYPSGCVRSCDRSQRQLPENVLLVCPQIPALGRFSRRDRHGGTPACNSNKHMNAPYGNNGRMNSKLQISVSLFRFSLVLVKSTTSGIYTYHWAAKVHFIVHFGC